MSSTYDEYIATLEAAMQGVRISKFIDGLRVVSANNEPMEMYCNNSCALIIANEPGVQRDAKHYQRKAHYIREVIEECGINILKAHADYNIANHFTKAVPCTKHVNHVRIIELHPASSLILEMQVGLACVNIIFLMQVAIGLVDAPSVVLSDAYYIPSLIMNLAPVSKICDSRSFYLWHSRLGHVSGSHLRFLASTGALGKLDTHDISDL
nr:hypothetical protein [Tanacetum cinerariifolium]